jgi:3-hydroxyisobutyrate dehydrogenase
MTTVGFVGLGNMGGPMARNLINAGHSLKVYDLDEDKVNMLVQAGAARAESVADAAGGAEMVVTMVPEGRHVREVFLGEEGIIAAVDAGTLMIDCSTIDVATAQAVHEAAAAAGFEMVDAPVSGGTFGAEAATLTFMCGGSAQAVAKATALLEGMGKNIVHCGGPGLGQAAKICNNMCAAINTIGVSEAFVLAERLGLDHQKLFDVVSTSSGQSFSLTSYCPVPGPVPSTPANRGYEPGFMAKLMAKDLRLAQAAAQDTGAATPLGAEASALCSLFVNCGYGEMDFSGIIKLIRGEIGKGG